MRHGIPRNKRGGMPNKMMDKMSSSVKRARQRQKKQTKRMQKRTTEQSITKRSCTRVNMWKRNLWVPSGIDRSGSHGWNVIFLDVATYEFLSTDRFRLALTMLTLGPSVLISGVADDARGTSDRRFRIPRRDSRGYSHFRCRRAH